MRSDNGAGVSVYDLTFTPDVSHRMPKLIAMKMIPFTSIAALLLLAGAGCTSVSSSGNDEAKVVARILARTAPGTLAFKDRAGAQQLVSSLDTSEYFDFGVILNAQKQVFASYFRRIRFPKGTSSWPELHSLPPGMSRRRS